MATVTFECTVPPAFATCTAKRIYLAADHGLGGGKLVVDWDFLGVTPLYSAKSPEVEYVFFFSFLALSISAVS